MRRCVKNLCSNNEALYGTITQCLFFLPSLFAIQSSNYISSDSAASVNLSLIGLARTARLCFTCLRTLLTLKALKCAHILTHNVDVVQPPLHWIVASDRKREIPSVRGGGCMRRCTSPMRSSALTSCCSPTVDSRTSEDTNSAQTNSWFIAQMSAVWRLHNNANVVNIFHKMHVLCKFAPFCRWFAASRSPVKTAPSWYVSRTTTA